MELFNVILTTFYVAKLNTFFVFLAITRFRKIMNRCETSFTSGINATCEFFFPNVKTSIFPRNVEIWSFPFHKRNGISK